MASLPLEKMNEAFRRVRKLRSKPAHALDDNTFDTARFQRQREIMMDAYNAVRTIRLNFASHPNAKQCTCQRSRAARQDMDRLISWAGSVDAKSASLAR
jgi:hypothetical protein